ncbi:hypothetical protein [Chachezhania sediminis]|uniref:hypothetical protein n=1 Tax=Chachezhania sediminis TaxID=2599291 RepID=UPI00131E146F|nr:hypothetical protein [Chachezhania sediminis]
MNLNVTGKTALLTSTSGGPGAHFARVLAEAGAAFTLGTSHAGKPARMTGALNAERQKADAVPLDFADEGSFADLFGDLHFGAVRNTMDSTFLSARSRA